jgi:hypothetical protein
LKSAAGDKSTAGCYVVLVSYYYTSKENDIMTTTKKRDEQFVRLPRDLYAQLAEIAEREDRSVAGTVRSIVREGIARRSTAAVRGEHRGAAR